MRINSLAGFLLIFFAASAGAQTLPTKPAAAVLVAPPGLQPHVEATPAFSPEFIHSIFPSKVKPGFMPIVGKDLVCHGFGTQGGQYACYAAHGDTASVDCFLDRYINETPIAQRCGTFELPTKMTKARTEEMPIAQMGTELK